MADQRNHTLKELISSVRFLISRQEFNILQIKAEQTRLVKSLDKSTTTHKKLEHVDNIRDYQLLLGESFRQLRIHHDKLQQFLDFNADLKNTELYYQAGVVLAETMAILKQLDESRANNAENGENGENGKDSEPQN